MNEEATEDEDTEDETAAVIISPEEDTMVVPSVLLPAHFCTVIESQRTSFSFKTINIF